MRRGELRALLGAAATTLMDKKRTPYSVDASTAAAPPMTHGPFRSLLLSGPVIACSFGEESSIFNDLILIFFCPARPRAGAAALPPDEVAE